MKTQAPSVLFNEAARLWSAGQHAAAAEACRRALAAKPTDADALGLMGVIEAGQGRLPNALGYFQRVVELRPKSPDAHFNLAFGFHRAGDFARAEAHYKEAARLKPNYGACFNNLGTLYQDVQDIARARKNFERAVQIDPAAEHYVVNLYGACRVLGDAATVERLTASALARWPNNPLHKTYRAEALFSLGRFEEAWRLYEARFKTSQSPAVSRALPHVAAWDGADIASLSQKKVLVWTEQGPGDELMYGTLLREIVGRVGELYLLCSPRMAPVFRRSFPDLNIFDTSMPPADVPAVDLQASLVQFAQFLRPSLAAFAAGGAYVAPDKAKAASMRDQYRAGSDDLLIGIAWRSSGVKEAEQKSVNLGVWGPLFALPGVRFVNLQYGDCAADIAVVKSEYGVDIIHDAAVDPLNNLKDYAAQVAAMDLVVCSSNTAAHFAGAIGVPTHCMLPSTPGLGRRWYWFERNGRCAWYPEMTLHMQRSPGAWVDVVRGVTLSVARILHERGNKDVPGFLTRLASAYGSAAAGADEVLDTLISLPGQELLGYAEKARLAKAAGDVAAAETYYDRALEYDPNSAAVLNMKGVLLADRNEYAAAETFYRRALAINPDGHEALNNLGTALRRQGRGAAANESYQRANAIQPDHPSILINLATNLIEMGQVDSALTHYERLLALKPDYAEAHQSRGFGLLSVGRFQEGWPELFWRHGILKNENQPSETLVPRWAGESVSGAKVLVWTEHGLGDEILTVSILPELVAQGADVTLQCSERLVTVFQRSFPTVRVMSHQAVKSLDLTQFKYQFSLPELGIAFRQDLAAFPTRRSFLKADEGKVERFRQRYRKQGREIVVGVSWASANPDIGALKNLDLISIVSSLQAAVAPDAASLVFVNLQYGKCGPLIEAAIAATGATIIDDAEVDSGGDMDTFAAQVAAMDVVVTISNTAAHFAGGLGVRTLLLLPYNRGRHWYWLRSSDNCPWYPAVSYFIQSADGSWTEPLVDCGAEVKKLSANSYKSPVGQRGEQ